MHTKTRPSDLITMQELRMLLGTPRFAGSAGELLCIEELLLSVPGMQQDSYGNLYIRKGNSRSMFSCHTDTVHKRTAVQQYELDMTGAGMLTAKGGGVLGADCGTGWLIMLAMLRYGIPGLYVWHREEEIGGGGSEFFASTQADLLSSIDRCVAFDRAGYSDVITHQGGCRGASDEFATALAGALNHEFHGCKWPPYLPDDSGVFTDSHNYRGIIPECTNLSVGYFGQHTTQERQDVLFMVKLIEACCHLDWESLPTKRTPGTDDYGDWWDNYGSYGADYSAIELEAVCNLVSEHPEVIAELLLQSGWDIDSLYSEVWT